MVRLKRPLLAQVLLLIGLLGAFGVGNYYPGLYVGEMAGLCVIVLHLWLVLETRVKSRGYLMAVLPAFALVSIVLLYAYVFSARMEAPLLPSVLAQRDFVFFLLAPIAYLLCARGWGLDEFRRIFLLAALLALANYVAVLATTNLEAWASSGNAYLEAQVTYDEARGYRLKGPTFVFLFAALYFGWRMLRAKSALLLGLSLTLTALPVALLIINAPRSAVMAVVAALVLYGAFLSRVRSTVLSVVLASALISAGIFFVPYLVDAFLAAFGSDWSYEVRVESAERAWAYFLEYPLLGIGQESYQSISYQDLLGERFYPSDIGLLGLAFQYGLVGVIVYFSYGLWVLAGMLRVLRDYDVNSAKYHGGTERHRAFLWALTIICLGFIVSAPLQTPFVRGEGIAVGALAWGLIVAHKHGFLFKKVRTSTPATKTVSAATSAGHRRGAAARVRD